MGEFRHDDQDEDRDPRVLLDVAGVLADKFGEFLWLDDPHDRARIEALVTAVREADARDAVDVYRVVEADGKVSNRTSYGNGRTGRYTDNLTSAKRMKGNAGKSSRIQHGLVVWREVE